MSPKEIERQRKIFNEWFSEILLQQGSCLLRDVLRNQKENLFQEWLNVQPVTTEEDIDKFIEENRDLMDKLAK